LEVAAVGIVALVVSILIFITSLVREAKKLPLMPAIPASETVGHRRTLGKKIV
jgi:hypothetical protein